MAIIQGQGSKLQIGLESSWGTKVAPTVNIGYTSESLKWIPNYKAEDTLVGGITTGKMEKFGTKVEGDVNLIVHPDNIGWLLWEHFGAEGNATAAGSAYYHDFTHVAAGTATSLPKFTMVVDRIISTYAFVSCKSDTLKLSCKVNDYLRATFSVRAHSEVGSTLISLSDSTTKALKFHHGSISIGGTTTADITSFDLTDSNALDNDHFVMNGSAYMAEIEPGARSITANCEVLWDAVQAGFRSAYFVAGTPCSAVVTFTSDEMIGGTDPYKLVITLPNVYITDASPVVTGPDRITYSIALTATHQSSTAPITVRVYDGKSTKYSA